jgi:hypothetical protein
VDGRLDWSRRSAGLACTFEAQPWRNELPPAQLTECQSRLVGHPERACTPGDPDPPAGGLSRLATVYVDPGGSEAIFVWYGASRPKRLRLGDSPWSKDVALGDSGRQREAMRLLVHKDNGDSRLILLHSDPEPANTYGEVYFGTCRIRAIPDPVPVKQDAGVTPAWKPPGLGWPVLPTETAP